MNSYTSADDLPAIVSAMCVAGRAVVAAGLVVGSGGNLSARLPGAATCWVTRAGSWLDRLTPDDFVEVAIADGAVVTAGRDAGRLSPDPRPSTEVQLHLATYRVRPDVNAIARSLAKRVWKGKQHVDG